MNKQQYNMLVQINNALYQIKTQGDDTLVMADVLVALRQLLQTITVQAEADREDTREELVEK